jgi:hypothetical protein
LEVDILGSKSVVMDGVFCNYNNVLHNGEITYEIKEFLEIKGFL